MGRVGRSWKESLTEHTFGLLSHTYNASTCYIQVCTICIYIYIYIHMENVEYILHVCIYVCMGNVNKIPDKNREDKRLCEIVREGSTTGNRCHMLDTALVITIEQDARLKSLRVERPEVRTCDRAH